MMLSQKKASFFYNMIREKSQNKSSILYVIDYIIQKEETKKFPLI